MPAKLAARVRVYSQGHGRKTDRDDAVSIGLAALDGSGVAPVAPDDVLVSLRLLCDRREELSALRTQAVCRLHRLLAELTPGGMRRELTAGKAEALLASVSDISCAGFSGIRFRMFIRSFSTALSEVLLPGLSGGFPEPGLPGPARADTACPGYLPVLLDSGDVALSSRTA